MITAEQVRDAITILRALAAGELDIPDALAVELLDAAAEALANTPGVTYITCEIDDDPITLSR